MDQERKQVLEMVRDGKLTVDEAQQILDAMTYEEERARPAASSRRNPRFLRIRVKDEDGSKVNLNIPISLAKVMWRFIPREAMNELSNQNIDIETILDAVHEGAEGQLIHVKDEDGDEVEISVV
ncbi:MAG: hypothetical protein WBL79_06955 [Bacillota bacterium]|nr:hypothetical protein [Bacillota bacterium]HOK70257.1 hypothetical protein [Bacillota bacterium]HOL52604.1 hypothetical protein [Bacillota bacterium]HPQ02948.1 hypothetical protein [Bacillota bacterium]